MSKITTLLKQKFPSHNRSTDIEKLISESPENAELVAEWSEAMTDYVLAAGRQRFLAAGGTLDEWNGGAADRVRTEVLHHLAMDGVMRSLDYVLKDDVSARMIIFQANQQAGALTSSRY